jgi:hypothetical protein
MLADQLGISNFPKSYFQKKKQKQKQISGLLLRGGSSAS